MGNAAQDNFPMAGDRIDPCAPRQMESSLYFSSGLLGWRVPRGKKGKLYYVLSKEKEQTEYVDRGKEK